MPKRHSIKTPPEGPNGKRYTTTSGTVLSVAARWSCFDRKPKVSLAPSPWPMARPSRRPRRVNFSPKTLTRRHPRDHRSDINHRAGAVVLESAVRRDDFQLYRLGCVNLGHPVFTRWPIKLFYFCKREDSICSITTLALVITAVGLLTLYGLRNV